jgi:hypothetical protein
MMEEIQMLREENRKLRSYLDSIGQFAINGAAAENGSVDDAATPEPTLPLDEDEPLLGMGAEAPAAFEIYLLILRF